MNHLIEFANWIMQRHIEAEYHRPVNRFHKVGQSFIDRRDDVELSVEQLLELFYYEVNAAQHDEDLVKLSTSKGLTEFDVTAGC